MATRRGAGAVYIKWLVLPASPLASAFAMCGRDDRLPGPLLPNPRTLLLKRYSSASSPRCQRRQLTGLIAFTPPQAAATHHSAAHAPDGDLSVGRFGAGAAGAIARWRRNFSMAALVPLIQPADYARADQRERAQNRACGAAAHGEQAGKPLSGGVVAGGVAAAGRRAAAGDVCFGNLMRESGAAERL